MAEKDKRDSVNTSSRPRAEPETVRQAETEAIETAMATGKDRRIRKKAQDERAAENAADLSEEAFEHDAREHSSRAGSVREGRTDADSITEDRTKGRSGRSQRHEHNAKEKASNKLMEGEGPPKESKLIYVDEDEIVPGRGMAGSRLRRLSAVAVKETVHRRITDEEDENVGVEASHHAEMLGEDTIRRGSARWRSTVPSSRCP